MKIGILTLPLCNNYGGILQAYALQTVLERYGNEVVVIDIAQPVPVLRIFLRIVKRFVKKYLFLRKNITIFSERKKEKEDLITSKHTSLFISRHIHKMTYKKYSDICESDYDAIVVGSDQVWRPDYFAGSIKHAFLDFAKGWDNIIRISYAASFGTDDWLFTKRQTSECCYLIKKFNAVSVRELSAVDICQKHWNIQATAVLDPTLLLLKDTYEQIVCESNIPQSPGNLLCYILDETDEKQRIIDDIAERCNLVPFRVNSKYEDYSAQLSERIQPPVEQWLRGFMDAKFVLTDSFHATVFSILFKKNFYVIGNKERGITRFVSLLSQLGLEHRLISESFEMPIFSSESDWGVVDEKLDSLRRDSIDYLNAALRRNVVF